MRICDVCLPKHILNITTCTRQGRSSTKLTPGLETGTLCFVPFTRAFSLSQYTLQDSQCALWVLIRYISISTTLLISNVEGMIWLRCLELTILTFCWSPLLFETWTSIARLPLSTDSTYLPESDCKRLQAGVHFQFIADHHLQLLLRPEFHLPSIVQVPPNPTPLVRYLHML